MNFAEKCDLKNVIFAQHGHLKCEFCEKFDFENVNYANYVKNVCISKNVTFAQNCDFENVNFLKYVIFNMWIFGWNVNFCPSVAYIKTFIQKDLSSCGVF